MVINRKSENFENVEKLFEQNLKDEYDCFT